MSAIHQRVLVLDLGGQYSQLVARRVRECSVFCEIKPHTITAKEVAELAPIGIILTGGPAGTRTNPPTLDPAILELGIPVLGICYGGQLIARLCGGEVDEAHSSEFDAAPVQMEGASPLFAGLPTQSISWIGQQDYIRRLPEGFLAIATDHNHPAAAFAQPERRLYGLQFRPEVERTEQGTAIISNFLKGICGATGDWTMADYARSSIEEIRATVGDGRVLLALSGGVDSTVVAALLTRAIGSQLTCIFVDHGFMRKNEGDEVEAVFKGQDLHFVRVNAEERFLARMKGVSDPEQKRKIIGEEFIRVFEEEAKKIGAVDFLAQGTIYPDIVESGFGDAAVVKSHHNVGGLPDKVDFKALIEPLRLLFKDEVRALGTHLGLPDYIVWRQPFPGPGLAIRVIGEPTKEKLDILRDADAIFREEIAKGGLDRSINQYFAVLTNIQTVGVTGDSRTYDYTLALRGVTTTDFMTAEWARIPYDVIERASRRIVDEVAHINRVVYDVTSKPPATIEWE
jgi:GMP synthase (glutamine-hydrolysing)